MISKDVEKAINDQIQKEFASAYLYLAMAAHFDSMSLPGFSHWMKTQYQEEVVHAMRFFNYLTERNGRVVLEAIEQPPVDFGSPSKVFQQTLDHERKVTASINALYELAVKENDYPTQTELQWFITEQVEEESTAENILDQLKLIGDQGYGLVMMDQQLASRPAPAASPEPGA